MMSYWIGYTEANNENQSRITKMEKRMAHGRLSSALSGWWCEAACRKRLRVKGLKAAGRWVKGFVGRMLEAWQERTVREARKRLLTGRVTRQMHWRYVSGTWSRWWMHVDKAQEERRADESRQRVMLTIIRRMMHGAMAWGFGVWSSKVLQASHERETMGRVLMRMSNRALSAGLGAWKEAVEDGRTERAEEERRQHVMSKVEKRMAHGRLSIAFVGWFDGQFAKRRLWNLFLRVFKRHCSRSLICSFKLWCHAVMVFRFSEHGYCKKG